MPPLTMSGVRFLAAGGILYAVLAAMGRAPRPTWPQVRAAAVVGTALLVIGNGAVSVAETEIASGPVALIVASVPLWMLVFDRLVNRAAVSPLGWIGVAVGLAGVALLVVPAGVNQVRLVPALIVVAGSVSWAAGSLYARVAPAPQEPLQSVALQMLCGGAIMIVVGNGVGEYDDWSVSAVSGGSWVALGYLVVAGSLVGFASYIWLLRNASAAFSGSYAFINPAVAVVLGAILNAETLTARTLLGGALTIVAVAAMLLAKTRLAAAKP
jgi:drug/metabolite transporter (DMT)-like permease